MVLRPCRVVKVHAISNCSSPTAALSADERPVGGDDSCDRDGLAEVARLLYQEAGGRSRNMTRRVVL